MTSKLKPAIWPRDTGQRILWFDRCQLIIARMSNIKEVHGKPRLYVAGHNYGRHVARLRRRRRAYAPTSNTASQNNHEKINSWVSFAFLYVFEYGAPLGGPSGRRSSAINLKELRHSFRILKYSAWLFQVCVLQSVLMFSIFVLLCSTVKLRLRPTLLRDHPSSSTSTPK